MEKRCGSVSAAVEDGPGAHVRAPRARSGALGPCERPRGVRGVAPSRYWGTLMATTAKIVKENKPPKFKVRLRNRCRLCGRPRGYLRKFALCRLCFRRLALQGDVAGVTKSSW